MNVLLSLGSAVKIGFKKGIPLVDQRTCYMMMEGKCNAGCLFCIRPKNETKLSRLPWYPYDIELISNNIGRRFDRVCIQSVNYPDFISDIEKIISALPKEIPISVSLSLEDYNEMYRLKGLVDRVGIGLDCATQNLFEKLKPFYDWDRTLEGIDNSVKIFGKFNVICHLISGLGETEKEMISLFQTLFDKGVYPALFAFTPIKGTEFEGCSPPNISSYRRLQFSHYLITNGIKRFEELDFVKEQVVFSQEDTPLLDPKAFLTKGCPSCDRPFYNESPKGPTYNFPELKMINLSKIKDEIFNHKIY
jgi:biotin synthase